MGEVEAIHPEDRYIGDWRNVLYSSAPQPVRITQLCKEKFYIPSYQRGYKWGESEIKSLLKDIANYKEEQDGKFYCLQPIVVRRDEAQGYWRVVDGQQRLTTVYLILRILKEDDSAFALQYERDTKLENYDFNAPQFDPSNSETYHITNAIVFIAKWLNDNEAQKEKLRENLLSHTNIIWYLLDSNGLSEVESLKREHQYFLNLNSGKISLTDAELVKALLLHKPSEGKDPESLSHQKYFAEEWDRMERTLRQEDVWYFIAGAKEPMSNSMDYLLDLIWRALPDEKRKPFENTDNYIFAWAEDNQSDVWRYIQQAFRVIMGWHSDCTLHNLIGFFASRKTKSDLIPLLLKRALGFDETAPLSTHSELRNELWRSALCDNNLICSEDALKSIEDPDFKNTFHSYRYDKNKKEIFDVLLLANIILVTIGENARKFDFYRFNSTTWNVEHISPKNPKDNAHLKTELKKVLDYYDSINISEPIKKEMPKEISEVKSLYDLLSKIHFNKDYNADLQELDGLSEEEMAKLESLKKSLIPTEDDDTMLMDNMTLLSEKCNKGIGNNFFFDKKIRIANYQAAGEYVPLLTLNVFTKWYSQEETPPHFWHVADRRDYLSALDGYFTKVISILPKEKIDELQGAFKQI